jgi:hypothetical protein
MKAENTKTAQPRFWIFGYVLSKSQGAPHSSSFAYFRFLLFPFGYFQVQKIAGVVFFKKRR